MVAPVEQLPHEGVADTGRGHAAPNTVGKSARQLDDTAAFRPSLGTGALPLGYAAPWPVRSGPVGDGRPAAQSMRPSLVEDASA